MTMALIPRVRNSISAMSARVTPRSPRRPDRLVDIRPPLMLLIASKGTISLSGVLVDLHVTGPLPVRRLTRGEQGRGIARQHQLRRDQDQQLGTPLPGILRPEELPQNGNVTQDRDLGR